MFDLVLDLDCANNQGLFFMCSVWLHLSYSWLQLKLHLIWLIYAVVTVVTVKEDFLLLIKNVKKIKGENLKKIKYISI